MGLLSGLARKYLQQQAEDAALFCILALLEKPKLADDPKRLARLAGKYILTHGTPNQQSVREYLT